MEVDTHLPLDGDRHSREMYEYIHPGDYGENVGWDFTAAISSSSFEDISYRVVADSIIAKYGTNSETIIHLDKNTGLATHLQRNDVLHKLKASPSCIFALFPFGYGDSISSPYCMVGEFSKHNAITIDGTCNIVADAIGTLILPHDTIPNTLRVHKSIIGIATVSSLKPQHSVEETKISKSKIEQHTYYWYAQNYRFPLCESHFSTYTSSDTTVALNCYSYITQTGINTNDDYICQSQESYTIQSNYNLDNIEFISSGNTISITDKSGQNKSECVGVELTIFDTHGRVYFCEKADVNPGVNYRPSLNCLLPGQYIATLRSGNASKSILFHKR